MEVPKEMNIDVPEDLQSNLMDEPEAEQDDQESKYEFPLRLNYQSCSTCGQIKLTLLGTNERSFVFICSNCNIISYIEIKLNEPKVTTNQKKVNYCG